MAQCEVCGNNYDRPLQITVDGKSHTFDSFECAIHVLAPTCAHCKCRVIGHGVEASGKVYCCAHCAHHAGASRVRDNESHDKPQ
jgi:hypothetical protein